VFPQQSRRGFLHVGRIAQRPERIVEHHQELQPLFAAAMHFLQSFALGDDNVVADHAQQVIALIPNTASHRQQPSDFARRQYDSELDIERLVIADRRLLLGFHPGEIVRVDSCPEVLVGAYGPRFQPEDCYEFRRPCELAGTDIPLPGADNAAELRIGHGSEKPLNSSTLRRLGRDDLCREEISLAVRTARR
jgi:hypothetical protein